MMFGNPAFLWALPAALVPVLLHLFNRKRAKPVDFSYLALIRLAHQSRMPKRRLRDAILLILRTLLLIFLVGLFARPVVRQGGILGGEGGRTIVLLDVSASMGSTFAGRERLDSAREEIQRVLRTLPNDAEVGLVTFSDRVEAEQAPTRDRARLIGVLSGAKVRARPSDVLPALKAAGAMSHGARAGTVMIVSDQAANVWRAATAARGAWEGHDPRTRYVIAEVGETPASRGIVDASLNLGEEGNLRGRASFLGNRSAPPAAWTLELNGRAVGKGEMALSGGRTDETSFQAQLPEGGYFSGKIFLTPDAMAFDDVFHLAGRVPKGFRVLLVDGERGLAPSDSEVYYLKSALESPRDPRIESIETVTPDAMAGVKLTDYDAIVAANAVELGGREADLRGWIENGGGLLLAPGSKWPKGAGQVLGVLGVSGRVHRSLTAKAPASAQGLLAEVAGLASFEWKQVKVDEYVTLAADSPADAVITLEDGTPLLVQRKMGKGNLAVLTTTLDRAWTNFPSKPAFAPLLRELIASLADPLREQTSLQAFVDEPVHLKLPEGTRSVSMVAPDGAVSSAAIDREGRLDWTPPPVTGLFEVRTDRPDQWFRLAVNMRDILAEADTRRAREADVREALPGATVQWVEYRAGSSNLLSAVQGRDITNALIFTLFALLLAETFLAWGSAWRTA
jgi:hypothetical protein